MDFSASVPTGTKSLAIATLVINLIFIQPIIFILLKHGKRGLLGWIYLQLLSAIRIIANAITIGDLANHSTGSTASTILNSVGLSPLILATTGILHEARRIRNPELNNRFQWLVIIQFHMFVSGSLALLVYGIVTLTQGKPTTTSKALLKVGAAGLVVCYALLSGYSFFSLRMRRQSRPPAYASGSKLLYAVIAALPFIAIRLGYAVASVVLEADHPKSGFLTSLTVKIVLGLVPEIIVQLIFIGAGIVTINANRDIAREKHAAIQL